MTRTWCKREPDQLKLAKTQLCTVADFNGKIAGRCKELEHSLNELKLYPDRQLVGFYLKLVERLIANYREFERSGKESAVVALQPLRYEIKLRRNELRVAKSELEDTLYRLRYVQHAFSMMERGIKEALKLEVQPIFGEQFWLARAKIVVQAEGVHIYDAMAASCPTCKEDGFCVEQKNSAPLSSIDEALRRYVDDPDEKFLQTVIIVKTRERYPICNTTLPLVLDHYGKKLYGKTVCWHLHD